MFVEVEHWWYRVESQNHGALHTCGIVWLKEGTYVEGSISAEKQRGSDADSLLLSEKVDAYQKNACYPNHCFHTPKEKHVTSVNMASPLPVTAQMIPMNYHYLIGRQLATLAKKKSQKKRTIMPCQPFQ